MESELNANTDYTEIEATRKVFLAKVLTAIGVVFLSVLGAIAFAQSNPVLGIVDCSSAFVFAGIFVFLHLGGSYKLGVASGLACFGFLTLFLMCNGGIAWTANMWAFVYPLAAVYLIGSRVGLFISLTVYTIFVVLLLVPAGFIPEDNPYSLVYLIRFTAVYVVILIISLYYESSRSFASNLIEVSHRQLQALSSKDGLTGVGNRRLFDTELDTAWNLASRTASPLSLLMIDLDDFKLYNDEYGHVSGDTVLQTIAKVLLTCASRTIDLVVRYGGEEFCVLLPSTNLEGAVQVAERVLKSVRELEIQHIHSRSGFVSVSIGVAVALAIGDEDEPSTVVERADRALYAAKRAGKGCYRVTEAVNE
jgi:diguanylate cyclase (GGDEF)-like protein